MSKQDQKYTYVIYGCHVVNQIRENYPDNFIGLAGISAGSGQVVSYIGREGSNVRVNAAASLCPAWDISSAFRWPTCPLVFFN